MALNIGELVAWISVDASRANRSVGEFDKRMADTAKSVGSRFQSVGGTITQTGDKVYGVGSSLTRGITMPAVGAVGAVAGITAALGWGRLKSVDTAQAQLKGMGYSAEDVNRISGQLSKDLEKGMMTMGEATFAAANGMAAGVKEGKELTRYIQLMDSAVVAGSGSFDEMNKIFGQTADLGYLTSSNFDMLTERLPGFSSAMQKHTGKSADALREMLNNGEISMEDFLTVIEGDYGQMAEEYAKSWEGMVQNTKAWVGIIGQTLLGGVFEQSKDAIFEFIQYLQSEDVQKWATEMGESIGNAFSQAIHWVKQGIQWWTTLDGSTKNLIYTIAGIAVAAGPVLMVVGKLISVFGTLVSGIGTLIASPLGQWLFKLVGRFTSLLGAKGVGGFSGSLLKLAGPIGVVIGLLAGIWTQSESFRNSVTELGGAIWNLLIASFDALWPVIQSLIPTFESVSGSALGFMATLGDGLAPAVGMVTDLVVWLTESVLPPLVSFLTTVVVPAVQLLAEFVAIAFTEIATVISGAVEIIMGIVNVFIGLFTGNWSQLWNGLGQIVSGAWTIIQGLIKGAFDRVAAVFNAALKALGLRWTGTWSDMQKSVTEVLGRIHAKVSEIVGKVVSWSISKYKEMVTGAKNVWNNLVNAIRDALNRARAFVTSIAARIVQAAVNAWQNVQNRTRQAYDNVVNSIQSALNRARDFVAGVVTRIVQAIVNAWNTARARTTAVFATVVSVIRNALNSARSTVSNAVNSIVSFFSNAWNRARSVTTSAMTGLRSAVMGGVNNVVNLVRQLPGRVISALGNVGSMLVGSGRSLISGFTRGIQNGFNGAVNAVKNGVKRVRNFFPFSPAKEGPLSGSGYTDVSGRKMIEDFAGGMNSAEDDVVRQAEAIARAAALEVDAGSFSLSPALREPSDLQRRTGQSVGTQVTNNFTINNPVEEPTSETARKASAYIGVTV